jgi:hypothetical protein
MADGGWRMADEGPLAKPRREENWNDINKKLAKHAYGERVLSSIAS